MTSIYQRLADLERSGKSVVLCSIIRTEGSTPRRAGAKMLVYPDGTSEGTVGGGELESRVVAAALESLEDNRPRVLTYEMTDPARGDPGVCGGQLEVYVEPIKPPATVVVVGAGHVGQSVAHLAHWLGFRVWVSDDRSEFCTPEIIPNADAYYPLPPESLAGELEINDQTYLILSTRNVEIDLKVLPGLLDSPAPYLGVIGSRRRWATTKKKLLAAGVEEAQLARVVSPMGLELNAETPEEIALSILAEIIMLRRQGDGTRMAD